jgi:hypothetical protein
MRIAPPTWLLCLGLALCIPVAPAGAQTEETPTGSSALAGPWWLKLGRSDRGAVLVEFTAPDAGAFTVADVEITGNPSFGFSRALGAFFLVPAGQELRIDARGRIVGELELDDADTGSALATLTIDRGWVYPRRPHLRLIGMLFPPDGEPVRVWLEGTRPPTDFPVLTGRGREIRVSGQKVRSRAFDLTVTTDEALGLPGYAFTGVGPLVVDGEEDPAASLGGRFMLLPNGRVFGLLEDASAFDPGPLSGSLVRPRNLPPILDVVARADRRLRIAGELDLAVEPVLSVTPASFAFPATATDETRTQTFEVRNIGAGELSGEATFLEGSDGSFSLAGDPTYTALAAEDPPVEIDVVFAPTTAGVKRAQLRFGVTAGPGSRVVQLSGTGGVAEIRIEPSEGAFDDFGDVDVDSFQEKTFAVHNDGDGDLEGSATLSGAAAFTLRSGTAETSSVDYDIAPGASSLVTVRFSPNAAGDRTTTLSFTGGGGASRTLTGTGVQP